MKKILLGITMLALGASIASAADISTKAPALAVSATPTINWTGLWVGGVGGYGFKNNGMGVTGNDTYSQYALAYSGFPQSIGVRPDGGILGLRLGYDYQVPNFANGNVVVGILGGYSYSGMRGEASAGGNLVGVNVTEDIKNIWDIFGRVGYLVTPRFMVAVEGGFTAATVNTAISGNGLICAYAYCPSGSSSDTKWGGSIGGEAVYRLDRNIDLSLIYLYSNLGTQNTTVNMACGKSCNLSFNNAEKVEFQRILAGLSYRF